MCGEEASIVFGRRSVVVVDCTGGCVAAVASCGVTFCGVNFCGVNLRSPTINYSILIKHNLTRTPRVAKTAPRPPITTVQGAGGKQSSDIRRTGWRLSHPHFNL